MSRVASAVLAEPPGPRPEKLPGCATDRARGARCALLWGGGAVPAAGWRGGARCGVAGWRGGACFGVAGRRPRPSSQRGVGIAGPGVFLGES